jgi:uncharacterized protein
MKKIIVDLKNIIDASVGTKNTIDLNVEIPSPDTEKIIITSPLTGKVIFINLEKQLLADFDLAIIAKLTCDRCAEKYQKKLNLNFKKTYNFSQLDTNQNLNLLPAIHEQMILSLPIQSLCGENCQGRCEKCGQNLNLEKCNCKNRTESVSNKPFAKLKELLE